VIEIAAFGSLSQRRKQWLPIALADHGIEMPVIGHSASAVSPIVVNSAVFQC
jgi:hypothetical protein